MRPLPLDGQTLGVGTPATFTWQQLLSFDACVQCGKCEAACPAFAAGQPLNPKKLIQDLVVGMAGAPTPAMRAVLARPARRIPPRRAGQPHRARTDRAGNTVGLHHLPRLCAGLPDADRTCRRHRRHAPPADAGTWRRAGKAAQALANLRETGTAGGFDLGARYHWAVDLGVEQIQPGRPVDALLIAGEGAFDMRYQRSLRALVRAPGGRRRFAVLGALETDTGDVARRLGDEATFQQLARALIHTLDGLDFQRIVTADPHVLHCLRNEYPALGGRYIVEHHSATLAALARAGSIRLAAGIVRAPDLPRPLLPGPLQR